MLALQSSIELSGAQGRAAHGGHGPAAHGHGQPHALLLAGRRPGCSAYRLDISKATQPHIHRTHRRHDVTRRFCSDAPPSRVRLRLGLFDSFFFWLLSYWIESIAPTTTVRAALPVLPCLSRTHLRSDCVRIRGDRGLVSRPFCTLSSRSLAPSRPHSLRLLNRCATWPKGSSNSRHERGQNAIQRACFHHSRWPEQKY